MVNCYFAVRRGYTHGELLREREEAHGRKDGCYLARFSGGKDREPEKGGTAGPEKKGGPLSMPISKLEVVTSRPRRPTRAHAALRGTPDPVWGFVS